MIGRLRESLSRLAFPYAVGAAVLQLVELIASYLEQRQADAPQAAPAPDPSPGPPAPAPEDDRPHARLCTCDHKRSWHQGDGLRCTYRDCNCTLFVDALVLAGS